MMRYDIISVAAGSIWMFSAVLTTAQAETGSMQACKITNPAPDCDKGNKWAFVMDAQTQPGAYVSVAKPGCMEASNKILQQTIQAAITALKPELATAAGTLSTVVAAPIGEALKKSGGDLSKVFSPYTKDGALCVPLAAVIPVASTEIQYRLLAKEEKDPDTAFAVCQPGQDCPVGFSRFDNEPIANDEKGVRTIVSVYMNWSSEKQRVGRMIIMYSLPDKQQPLTQF